MFKTRKIITSVFFAIFLIGMVSAYLGEFPMDECVDIKVLSSCNNVSLSIVETDDTTFLIDAEMNALAGQTFNYSFCNTSAIGEYRYTWDESCVDCSGGVCGNNFFIGNNPSISFAIIYVALILFIIGLGVVYYKISQKVNFEKWNNSIYQKYENKNYVKLVLSSIGYNLMKNKFIIYYLLGLPIILLITEVTLTFNIASFHTVLVNFMIVYLVGLLLVSIIFLSHVQEWFMDLLNMIRDMDWGIER